MTVKRLNPFFFRSLVGRGLRRGYAGRRCLNPFFFRSLVGLNKSVEGLVRIGLNPFFFRSLVGPKMRAKDAAGVLS